MKRYNVKGMPVEFIEVLNGYWIKHEDYENTVLDYNKIISRMSDSGESFRQAIKDECNEKLEKQHRIIIYLSTATFAMASILLFKVLS